MPIKDSSNERNHTHIEATHAQVSRSHDAEDEEHHDSNTEMGTVAAIDTLVTLDDELSPVPFSLCSHALADGEKSKENAAIETIPSTNDDGPRPPLSIRFDDDATTENFSRLHASTGDASEQSDSSAVRLTLAAESSDTNRSQADSTQQSGSMQPEVGFNHGLFSSPPVGQSDSTHSSASANVLSQSVSHENVHDEEDREDDIVIPEAFLVEANEPPEVPDVEVAELVEPDHSAFPVKKCYAFAVSIFIVAIVVAMGLLLRPPPSPRSATIKYEIQKNVLQRNATFDGMKVRDDRVLALDWITDEDPMKLDASDANLFQRYVIALVAFGFRNLDWLADKSECEWLGVECDMHGHVIELELSKRQIS